VVDADATLGRYFFQIPVAERVSEIPTDAQDNNFVPEVSSTKQLGPPIRHVGSPYQIKLLFATDPTRSSFYQKSALPPVSDFDLWKGR
jgi:hypothetical protein